MVHHNLLAQGSAPTPKNLGTFEGLGPLGKPTATLEDPGTSAFTNFLSTTVGLLTVVAIIWFLFNIFMGAIAWISSEGDKAKLQSAQKRITHAIVGLIVVISAIFLIKVIGTIFGINILDIGGIIQSL